MGVSAKVLQALGQAGSLASGAVRGAASAAGPAVKAGASAVKAGAGKAAGAVRDRMPQVVRNHPYAAGAAGLGGVMGLAALGAGGDSEEMDQVMAQSGIPADAGILGGPEDPSLEDVSGSAAKRDRTAKQVRQQLKSRIERMVQGQYPPDRILKNLTPYMQGLSQAGGEGDDLGMLSTSVLEATQAGDPNEILKGIYAAVQ